MAKITYNPVKELVVHEAVRVSFEDLLLERITPAGNMPLYWCNGTLFSFSSLPMTRDVVRDYMNGIIHWMEIHYTDMKEYKPLLELNDDNFKATLRIKVIDTGRSTLHTDVVKWLKTMK